MSTGAGIIEPNPVRLLVASADPNFRSQFSSEALQPESDVDHALSGAHALAKLNSRSFDTLILDRQLPDLNVHEVAQLVRRRFPQVNVKIVDGLSETVALTQSEPPEKVSPVKSEDQTEPEGLPAMVGRGRAMQRIYQVGRAGCHAGYHCADHGGDRNRERTRCAGNSSDQPPRQQSFCGGELRGDSGSLAGSRIVRARARSFYRRGTVARRAHPQRAWRHAVSG